MEQEMNKDLSLRAQTLNEASLLERLTIQLEKGVYVINNILHKISSVILFLLMFLTAFDVGGRYFFNKPITGTYELTGLALAVIIFFSLGMAQIKKDHIEIDFLTNMLPRRAQAALYALTSLILFILMSLTSWQLFEYMKRILHGNELSGDLGLPLYIFVLLAVAGAACFTLTFFVDVLKSCLKVVKK
jgi:TRAP-type transport system small permease protein